MSNVVIVALPEKDDPIWEISSETVPHLTLLFLGESNSITNVFEILRFLDHAATTVLHRFSLEVDRRGTLGDDQADVLFFEGWDLPELKRFRGQLLQNDNIKKAYLASDQHPEWLPHLTLGYPTAPAKKLKDGRDRVYSVRFDRVALWVDDYAGPEFPLKRYEYAEVSMSTETGKDAVDEILSHVGVKGMKWGVRKADNIPTDVTVTRTPKGGVKTTGGKNQPTHPDAVTARVAIQKAKKSGVQSLSNRELQALSSRMNLEKKVKEAAGDKLTSDGKAFVDLLMALA